LSGIHGLGTCRRHLPSFPVTDVDASIASDNALEFAVILASGLQVTANAENNPDLFWALKGGGGSTFAAVYSVTLKTYPVVPVTGAAFNMLISQPNFWKGVQAFHESSNAFVDAGWYVSYVISPTKGLSVPAFVAPNKTVDEFNKVVQPFIDRLKTLNLTFSLDTPKAYASFYDLHGALFARADDASGGNSLLGGRLFSKDDVAKNDGAIVEAMRAIVEAGHPYGGHMVNPGRAVADPTGSISAVHPVWRKSADSSRWVFAAETCQPQGGREKIYNAVTHGLADALRKASPTSGVYVNEVGRRRAVRA